MRTRYQGLDSLRVVSAFLVVLSHFSYYFHQLPLASDIIAGTTGRIGVSLFFFISGFLAANSLNKPTITLKNYYLTRYIRIIIPYLVAYILMSVILFFLLKYEPSLIKNHMFSKFNGTFLDYLKFIPVLLGFDGMLNGHFPTSFYFFTGEWFIGTVIMLYALSPLFYSLIKKQKVVSLFLITIFSIIIYYLIEKKIDNPFWFFLCRIPEFLLGMIIFNQQKELLKKENKTIVISLCLSIIAIFALSTFNPQSFQRDTYFPLTPLSFLLTIPLLVCFYFLSHKINAKYNLKWFNANAKYIYIIMLIHHVILIWISKLTPIQQFNYTAYFFLFLLSLLIIYLLSALILQICKPIERYLIQKWVK